MFACCGKGSRLQIHRNCKSTATRSGRRYEAGITAAGNFAPPSTAPASTAAPYNARSCSLPLLMVLLKLLPWVELKRYLRVRRTYCPNTGLKLWVKEFSV